MTMVKISILFSVAVNIKNIKDNGDEKKVKQLIFSYRFKSILL
jgi:hypothetical protein